jgi:hypothetical protein
MPGKSSQPSRRDILKTTTAALGVVVVTRASSALLAAEPATPGPAAKPYLRVLLVEADNAPLDPIRTRQLDARDLQGDPLPQTITSAEGRVRIVLADEPIQIMTRLKVPGFGEINCFADNDGAGYSKPGNIDFVVDAAQTRRRRVREAMQRWTKQGVPISAEIRTHMEAADRPLEPIAPRPRAHRRGVRSAGARAPRRRKTGPRSCPSSHHPTAIPAEGLPLRLPRLPSGRKRAPRQGRGRTL